MKDESVDSFITLTNAGYINFTLNCLKSLEHCKYSGPLLKCYCMDDQSFDTLRSVSNCIPIMSPIKGCSQLSLFADKNFSTTTGLKISAIQQELSEHPDGYVCLTDGDIVFKSDTFLQECYNIMKSDSNIELVTQCDNNFKWSNDGGICTGFMLIRSTQNTRDIFNLESYYDYYEKHIKNTNRHYHDQIYINDIRSRLNYRLLSLDKFPCGSYFYKHHTTLTNPSLSLVHFNWISTSQKVGRMKSYKMWYI